jgi:hypothetical protein
MMTAQAERKIPAFYKHVRRIVAATVEAPSMWTRSEVIGLAKASCGFCHGYGLLPILHSVEEPCKCVFRAIFRACHARYRECEAMVTHTNGVGIERAGGPSGYRLYSRKRQEYTADFALVAHRILVPEDHDLFRLHFLGRADWRACCCSLHIDRGTFFHRVYTITERLGRTFAELRPYPLYPVSTYFAGVVQSSEALPLEADVEEAFPPALRRQRMVAGR